MQESLNYVCQGRSDRYEIRDIGYGKTWDAEECVELLSFETQM
jgi:hypothetical protein